MKYSNFQTDGVKLGGKHIRANVVHEIDVVQDVQFEVETITVCLLYTQNYKKNGYYAYNNLAVSDTYIFYIGTCYS